MDSVLPSHLVNSIARRNLDVKKKKGGIRASRRLLWSSACLFWFDDKKNILDFE